ncbi:hypothetical protein V8E36_009819 [Tilletia maclaganii]
MLAGADAQPQQSTGSSASPVSTNFSFQQHHHQQPISYASASPITSAINNNVASPAPFPSSNTLNLSFPSRLYQQQQQRPTSRSMGPPSMSFHQYQQQQQQQGIGGLQQQSGQQQQGCMQQFQQNNNGGSQASDGSGNGIQQGFGPGSSTTGTGASGNGPNPPEYTLAGILHFLQSEWRRYERDRNEWEIERAEMRARIALLEGERRGAENLKTDLMRRVKMLEFALRQERSKYLAQHNAGSNTAGSPGQTIAGTPIPGGPPGGLAKHPLIHADKASSSGRSSPVARSEDLGKDGFGAASATFQAHPLRGPSNLSTNSFTASSLPFGGNPSGGAGAASTVLFNPSTGGAPGTGSTMSFNPATAPNASMLSRHTSLARDSKSRAKSRDYLKQCLSEISYLTNPATLNPLNERTYISGAVPAGSGPGGAPATNGAGAGFGPGPQGGGALGLAPLGAGAASGPAPAQPTAIFRPRKVMYDDAGTGGGVPPLPPPPPPPPTLPAHSLPNAQPQQPPSTSAPSASGFVVQGGGLERAPAAAATPAASNTDAGLPEQLGGSTSTSLLDGDGASDPLGVTSSQPSKTPEIQVLEAGATEGTQSANVQQQQQQQETPAPVEDAAELMPAPSPSGAEAVVPDVPAPSAASAAEDAHSSSSSDDSEDDRASDGSSASSSTTVGEDLGSLNGGKGETGTSVVDEVNKENGEQQQEQEQAGHFFEQRSGGTASGPDRMSVDSEGRPLPQAEDVEREIEDEIDDEDDDLNELQRTAIYRPGGVPPSSSSAPGTGAATASGGGSIAEATPDDWRRLREAGALQRRRREQDRLARQAAEGRTNRSDPLADARAHLAETTERVNALLAGESGSDSAAAAVPAGAGAGAEARQNRPGLVRSSSGRADEDELANLKLDPVPDEADAPTSATGNRRARAGSALSNATSSEAVADTQPWKAKRVLRGHLDSIRAVAFDTIDASVMSAGDDCTIKYWRLDPATLQSGGGGAGGHLSRESSISSLRSGGPGGVGAAGGTSAADYPILTFRGHTEPVTCLAVSPPAIIPPSAGESGGGRPTTRRWIYSGSLDASIRVWPAPELDAAEAYPPVEHTLELGALVGHTDAVWDLMLFSHLGLLVSVGADGMIKIWATDVATSFKGGEKEAGAGDGSSSTSPVSVGTLSLSFDYFGLDPEDSAAVEAERSAFLKKAQDAHASDASEAVPIRNGGLPVPTCVTICHSNIRLCAVGFTNAEVKLFDVTTGKEVMKLSRESSEVPASQINAVVSHPTLPILFTAHDDGHVQLWDLNTGAWKSAMLAHLDSTTTLDIDPAGLTLVSGGHDCSVRFWDIRGGGAAPISGDGTSSTEEEGGVKASTAAAVAAVDVGDNCVQEITSHRKKAEEGVLSVRYHSSAPFFASAGADGVVRLFG